MPHLTEAEQAAYARDGFVRPIRVLSDAEAAAGRAAFEAFERAAEGRPRPAAQYLRVNAHLASDAPLAIARDARVLDAVESVLGPDLLLWSAEYFVKEPGSAKVVTWHQDLTYWGMDGSDHEVTAWIALSPATAASGCMRFVPGSHRQAIVPHRDTFSEDNLLSRGQEIAVEVDEADAVDAELAPGEMSLHHGRLFHASGPNVTGDRRIGLVFRFIRPDTPSAGAGPDYAMLMRGADRTRGRINLAPPPGGFTTAHLALYEEVLAAQAGTLSDGAADAVALYAATDKEATHA
jgi:ectoine hydroxylase-related dioxygenase (phytanoyl-CoA dioxygenase family)